uniref:Promethin isoform X2 n=1 Tax=Geotrypetes seraphini TaxID=260995 RepID=A0A6P8P7G7_GEOSA|nr:promethin isoform X2 [Geotrypetes seraphini]
MGKRKGKVQAFSSGPKSSSFPVIAEDPINGFLSRCIISGFPATTSLGIEGESESPSSVSEAFSLSPGEWVPPAPPVARGSAVVFLPVPVHDAPQAPISQMDEVREDSAVLREKAVHDGCYYRKRSSAELSTGEGSQELEQGTGATSVVAFLNSPIGQYLNEHPCVALTLLVFFAMSAIPIGLFLLLIIGTAVTACVGVIIIEGIVISVGGIALLCVLCGLAALSIAISGVLCVCYLALSSLINYCTHEKKQEYPENYPQSGIFSSASDTALNRSKED